jgi:hypothetical protein
MSSIPAGVTPGARSAQVGTCDHTKKQARSLQLAAVITASRSTRAMEGTLSKIEPSPRSASRGPSA